MYLQYIEFSNGPNGLVFVVYIYLYVSSILKFHVDESEQHLYYVQKHEQILCQHSFP